MNSKQASHQAWTEVSKHYNRYTDTLVFLDDLRVVTEVELAKIWDLSPKMISDYQMRGLPLHEASKYGLRLYDLEEAIKWRTANVNRTKGKALGKALATAPQTEDGSPTPVSNVERQSKAVADKAVEDAQIAALKRKQLEGSLVSSEDVDITLAEMAVVFLTELSNDKKILPAHLQNQTGAFIKQYLDDHNSKRFIKLTKLVSAQYDVEDVMTLHDVIHTLIFRLAEGESPSALVAKL